MDKDVKTEIKEGYGITTQEVLSKFYNDRAALLTSVANTLKEVAYTDKIYSDSIEDILSDADKKAFKHKFLEFSVSEDAVGKTRLVLKGKTKGNYTKSIIIPLDGDNEERFGFVLLRIMSDSDLIGIETQGVLVSEYVLRDIIENKQGGALYE